MARVARTFRMERFRFIALWICLICIVVFVFQIFVPGLTDAFLLDSSSFVQPWRFVTSIFLHGGISHLLFNLLALALFGTILERLIGSKRFLFVFFITGILASLFSVFFYDAALGASGAIFGVIGALIVIRPTMTVWLYFMPMPLWLAGIVWAIGDIIGIFVPSGTANLAHLSGLAFGLLLGFYFRRGMPKQSNKGPIRVVIDENHMRKWEDNYLR